MRKLHHFIIYNLTTRVYSYRLPDLSTADKSTTITNVLIHHNARSLFFQRWRYDRASFHSTRSYLRFKKAIFCCFVVCFLSVKTNAPTKHWLETKRVVREFSMIGNGRVWKVLFYRLFFDDVLVGRGEEEIQALSSRQRRALQSNVHSLEV